MLSASNSRFLLKTALLWACCVSISSSMSVTPFLPQSFFFDWNVVGQPVPIPVTHQCEVIHITWSRSTATGPNPTSPYYLQVYLSTSIVPIIVPAGDGLTFDWAVPFSPNTIYQVCMFDKFGNTGGCQGMYTVIPATSTPTCSNVTYPPLLGVDAQVDSGPMSQFGWVDQCSDISITPQNGTPPYTLTVAPALHPPYNISSPDMKPINWTVSLNWATPFFISLQDSVGNMWANGPLHAGGGGTIACLAGNVTTTNEETIKPAVAIGAGVGGLGLGLLLGILGAWLVLRGRYKKKMDKGRFADPAGPGSPQALMFEEGGRHGSQYRAVPTTSSTGALTNSLSATSHPSMGNRMPSTMSYHVEPFVMPDEEGRTTAYGHEPRSPNSGYQPTLGTRLSTVASDHNLNQRPSAMPSTPQGSSNQVYVVHHDQQSAPVTIYHGDGTRIVELPPAYPPLSRGQSEALSEGSRSDGSRGEGRGEATPGLTLHQERKPGQIRKPARGPPS